MKTLVIFDGGLAPGYTTVAVGLVEEAEKLGWETWVARSGFRSLCEGISDEPQLVRAVNNPIKSFELNNTGVPTEAIGRRFFHSGSDFRSERFPDFKEVKNQEKAVKVICENNFEAVIVCGGDGSLKGVQALDKLLPTNIQTGFINISADSDISGDRSVGFLSCAEHGAKIVRGLYEDAYTHRRIYLLEMMGNESGRHALHAGAAARAHLIILPRFSPPAEVMQELADELQVRRHALIAVAEGYKKQHRKDTGSKLNAAEQFAKELAECGLIDRPNKRIIAEPFSRHLRGMQPLMIDCQIAHLKCQILVNALSKGESGIMAFYQSSHMLGIRNIHDLRSDNTTEKAFSGMINRLNLPLFNKYAEEVLD